MFRSLRQRLIWSQIIPLLLVLPVMGVLLVYSLEKQFIIPQLAQNLLGNARLLAEVSSAEFELWGDPVLFESMISRVQLDPAIQVMFLDGQGGLLYSSDPADLSLAGKVLQIPGLEKVQAGQELALTNYSILRLSNVTIDVFEPVTDVSHRVLGIVRLTYRLASLYELFSQVRWQVGVVLLLGLVVSAGLGTWLAVGISRPVRDVTQSIYALATGQRHEPLEETGPEELRSQARAVNFLVEQLHNLEQSRRQLLANLVHELGRPLGALRAAIHAVSKGADQDPVLFSDLMRGMDDETARLQHLLDDLANLYDKALGGLELDRQPVETVGWMRGVLRPWQAAAQEKRLGWQENIPAELPPISIDSMRMAQVIGNLLSNAIKYTPPGGSVAVSAGVREGEFWFKVSDSGLGIKPEEREKIFQAFYRGDDGRRIKQGMGLGLTIARDLVSAHGGRIGMESEPGSGSTFTVYVPLV